MWPGELPSREPVATLYMTVVYIAPPTHLRREVVLTAPTSYSKYEPILISCQVGKLTKSAAITTLVSAPV